MRALYSLAEMPDLLERYREKNIAVIGDGPSKLKYIFARRKVLTFAINRAVIDYPADFGVCLRDHLDMMLGVMPVWVPLIYISNQDMLDLRMERGGLWTATTFVRWAASWAEESQAVYLQGFDLSGGFKKYDGTPNEYELQAIQFRQIVEENPSKRIVQMIDNPIMPFLPFASPDPRDIL